MINNYPKFTQRVKDELITPMMSQSVQGNHGVIISYDIMTNTASVILAGQGTDQVGEILHHVMCPVQLGVQSVSPENGRLCWVAFKDAALTMPVITHFFSHIYGQVDFNRQNKASLNLPRYIVNM